jgi:GNAT superfamily N-acetyltransferase
MIHVRRATAADRQPVLALVPLLVGFGPPAWRDPGAMTRTDLDVIAQALQSTSEDPVVHVAELDGALAGFVHVHSLEDYYRRKRHGHVADIVVAPFAQGHGVATELLLQAQRWAIRRCFDWLSISVFERNRHALEIYERQGFGRDILRLVKPLSTPAAGPDGEARPSRASGD